MVCSPPICTSNVRCLMGHWGNEPRSFRDPKSRTLFAQIAVPAFLDASGVVRPVHLRHNVAVFGVSEHARGAASLISDRHT